MAWPQHYLRYPANEKAQLDREGFEAFITQLKKSDYAKKSEVTAKAWLNVYFGLRDWSHYAATVNGMLSDHIIPMSFTGSEWLYSYADIINRFAGDDKAVLGEATKWTKLISYDIKDINAASKATYLDLYATLLEKTGHADQAVAARKDIDQQQLDKAKSAAPFQMLIRPAPPKQN